MKPSRFDLNLIAAPESRLGGTLSYDHRISASEQATGPPRLRTEGPVVASQISPVSTPQSDSSPPADSSEPTATILWIDRNPHDMELAVLVLARLAPQFSVIATDQEENLEGTVAGVQISLVVLGNTPRGLSNQADSPGVGRRSSQATVHTAQDSDPNRISASFGRLFPNVPILLFSEMSSEQGLRYLRSGFDDFLPKSSQSFLELPQFLTKALHNSKERRLRQDRETRLSRLLDYTGVGAFRANIDGSIVDANAAFLQIFGLRDLDHAQRSDFTRLLRPSSDSMDDAPLREIKEVRVDNQRRRLRFTRVVLLTPDGGLTIDGLVEDIGLNSQPARLDTRKFATDPGQPGSSARLNPNALVTEETQTSRRPSKRAPHYPRAPSVSVVSLADVLQGVIEQLSVPLDRIQAQVQLGVLPRVPGDVTQLTVLFRNLLENSIRFRSKRALLIEVNSRKTEDSVIISVQDNGIGMSAPRLHRILSPSGFSLAQQDREGLSPLGLAISRRIVEHHRGKFWAESVLDRGTIFFVSLPLPDTSANPTSGTPGAPGTLS